MGKKEIENYIDRVKFGRSYRKYAKDLAKFGDGLVSDLIKVLQDDVDVDVRSSAAVALGNIGHQTAVPALIKALEPDEYVRYFASEALGRIGEPAVPNLIVALKHTHHDVRRAAASSLGDVGPDARAAVPDLSVALKDEHWEVRKAAVDALRKIGPDAEAAVPALIEATNKDTDADVRHAAGWALMNIRRKE